MLKASWLTEVVLELSEGLLDRVLDQIYPAKRHKNGFDYSMCRSCCLLLNPDHLSRNSPGVWRLADHLLVAPRVSRLVTYWTSCSAHCTVRSCVVFASSKRLLFILVWGGADNNCYCCWVVRDKNVCDICYVSMQSARKSGDHGRHMMENLKRDDLRLLGLSNMKLSMAKKATNAKRVATVIMQCKIMLSCGYDTVINAISQRKTVQP